ADDVDALISGLERILERPSPPREKLVEAVRNHVGAIADGLAVNAAYHHASGTLPTGWATRIARKKRDYDRRLEALIRQAQSEGAVPGGCDARVGAKTLMAMCNSICLWYNPAGHIP